MQIRSGSATPACGCSAHQSKHRGLWAVTTTGGLQPAPAGKDKVSKARTSNFLKAAASMAVSALPSGPKSDQKMSPALEAGSGFKNAAMTMADRVGRMPLMQPLQQFVEDRLEDLGEVGAAFAGKAQQGIVHAVLKKALPVVNYFYKSQPGTPLHKLTNALASFGVQKFAPWQYKLAFKAVVASRWVVHRSTMISIASITLTAFCPRVEKDGILKKTCHLVRNGLAGATVAAHAVKGVAHHVAGGLSGALVELGGSGTEAAAVAAPGSMTALLSGLDDQEEAEADAEDGDSDDETCTIELSYIDPVVMTQAHEIQCLMSLACWPCVYATQEGSSDEEGLEVTASMLNAAPGSTIHILEKMHLHLRSNRQACTPPKIISSSCDKVEGDGIQTEGLEVEAEEPEQETEEDSSPVEDSYLQ
eukprot:gb/GFBE01066642.1/.p1 GENE.gb/GFBE01066642.1/~~gb/GFBE01066642.1/.p1  ORF type:complete len:418 (+),score=83.34 gb/GFBE01066642.1/:1-1254(+)